MWAVLGDIEFELTNHPSSQDERSTTDYAQHPLIQGKPRLELVADALDEITLELMFHASLHDPEQQIRILKAAKNAHQPLPYVLGSGDYRGIYLITEVNTTTRKTTAKGRLIAATVRVSLLEYSGRYTKPRPVPRGLLNNLQADPESRIGGSSLPLATLSQKALGLARTAGGILQAGMEAFQFAKGLRDNPMAMLSQAPRLASLTGQALGPLQGLQGTAAGLLASGAELLKQGGNVAGDALQALDTAISLRGNPLALLDMSPRLLSLMDQIPVGALQRSATNMLAGGAELLQLGVSAAGDVQQSLASLSPISLDTVVGKVDYASSRMQQALSRADAAAPRLASMAADIVTRRA